MGPQEKYLFDVRGYLVVPGVLSADEVSELHDLLDRRDLWQQADDAWRNDEHFLAGGEPHRWEPAFRSLIANPVLMPYLQELCGEKLRYDHGHVILMRRGSSALRLHGGGTPFDPGCYYAVRDGRMYNGLVAVAISLVDAAVEDGGFVCIPGSHKAAFGCPPEFLRPDADPDWLTHVPVTAGSAIVFTEALTHGTWPWTAEHERRAVFLKYTPAPLAYAGDYPLADSGDEAPLRTLLERPYAVAGDSLR